MKESLFCRLVFLLDYLKFKQSTMAKILYGKPVREELKETLKNKVSSLSKVPVLTIVQVGNRDDSNVYIKNKQKFGEEIGVKVILKKYGDNISEMDLINEIRTINKDDSVDGIIVQLPLPGGFNSEKIIDSIDISKDADGLRQNKDIDSENIITPATARAVMLLMDFYDIDVSNKKVAVLGRSRLAGGPIAKELAKRGATVEVCHRETMDIKKVCKNADIIISATGNPKMIDRDFVKNGQIIIDVGINKLDGKLVGDVYFEEVSDLVEAITPVPGGVGPLTVACLFMNLIDLCGAGF